MWHLRGIFVSSTYLSVMCGVAVAHCCFLGHICVIMWCIYINHSSRTSVHIYVMLEEICSVTYANNVKCISVFLVTLLIALGSYKGYIY